MNTVIVVNLNGNAFHIEEPGFGLLRAYLEGAQAQLKDNPDKIEIMADLEQAIADKCAHFLGPHKNVVTVAEIESVLKEMGPVQTGDSAASSGASAEPQPRAAAAKGDPGAARRLTALRVARPGSARVAAVAARLAGLPLLPPLPAAVPRPGLPWTDGGEVRELPLVWRRGVIPLPLRHVAFLTCPAATRSAGE